MGYPARLSSTLGYAPGAIRRVSRSDDHRAALSPNRWAATVITTYVRVFYDVTEKTVEVLAIVPKDEADEWLEKAGEPHEDRSPE